MPTVDLASEHGVSAALARARAAALGDVVYHLFLRVSAVPSEPVTGSVTVAFTLTRPCDVILDFAAAPERLGEVRSRGSAIEVVRTAEHVVVPAHATTRGHNDLTLFFVADPAPLNRRDDFLYSLFVPARARMVFPCFDQPDIKATFNVTLELPLGWVAVSNAPALARRSAASECVVTFAPTRPLPTYLLAFAAGRLRTATGERSGRTFRLWYREPDERLLVANRDVLLDLHATAVAWLERYTGVPYPFPQFDIVLVPSFQFSGMEHPGAIYYNAARLLLEEAATDQERLNRVSLIAHETAHIWFGDLVTMRWFDDVWLKEVFANFMAARIVAEVFPADDPALGFFLKHYPPAYAVDRSAGAHAIRQPLDNLSDAAQLYGPIIYLKAPIVFRQLERTLGAEAFRDGVRRYLSRHAFGNASWEDLLAQLAPHDGGRLSEWCSSWIERPGRPTLRVEPVPGATRTVAVVQDAEEGKESAAWWPQQLTVTCGSGNWVEHVAIGGAGNTAGFSVPANRPSYVLAGGGGLGYGRFPLDVGSRRHLLATAPEVPDPLTRAVAWVTLWDELLAGELTAADFLAVGVGALAVETSTPVAEYLLSILSRAFWLCQSSTARDEMAPAFEACLHGRLVGANSARDQAMWFAALRQNTTTESGRAWLARVWRRAEKATTLPLSEADETALALDLAVQGVKAWPNILDEQRERLQDPEERDRLTFLAPFLSPTTVDRENAFAALADVRTRTREVWVLSALQYLNHPTRQAHARRFLKPGLALLPELQRTGAIFLPARWVESLLSGHASPAAAELVREFLAAHPAFPLPLRRTVLIAADFLFRVGRPPH